MGPIIDSLHLIWAILLFCTTVAWVTVGQGVANPYVPYRTSKEGRQVLLLVCAALSVAMTARSVGVHSLLAVWRFGSLPFGSGWSRWRGSADFESSSPICYRRG